MTGEREREKDLSFLSNRRFPDFFVFFCPIFFLDFVRSLSVQFFFFVAAVSRTRVVPKMVEKEEEAFLQPR